MSSNAKGALAEKAVRDAFEALSFPVHRAIRSMYNSNDIFGVFDLIVGGPGRMILIQVTTNDGVYARKKKIEEWISVYGMPDAVVCLARRIHSGRNSRGNPATWKLYVAAGNSGDPDWTTEDYSSAGGLSDRLAEVRRR